MAAKHVRIMFYDTTQKQWVVDTMEIANEGANDANSDQVNNTDADGSSEN